MSPGVARSIEKIAKGREGQPEQTAAFARALQTAVLHVQSAQRQGVQAGGQEDR